MVRTHGTHRAPARHVWAWSLASAFAAAAATVLVMLSLPTPEPASAGVHGSHEGHGAPAAPAAPPPMTAAPSLAAAPPTVPPGDPADMEHMATLVAATSPRGQALQTRIDAVLERTPLRFGPDSTTLTPDGTRTVEQVAGMLRDDPAARVQVVGHTAMEIADLPLCQRLSEERADFVASRLMSYGVGPERLSVVGVSHSHPAPTDAASRRVELVVTG